MKYKKGDILMIGKYGRKIHAVIDGLYFLSSWTNTEDTIHGMWVTEEFLDMEGYTLKPKECEHVASENLRGNGCYWIETRKDYIAYCPDCNSIYLNGGWVKIES